MPHYPPSTRGGATCYPIKVAPSFPASPPPKQQIVGWFLAYLHTRSLFSSLSLSLLLCPWQTLDITARTADRSPGWMSALATVGTGGKMEGVMEGGEDRRIIWGPLPEAPLLASWHQKRWFRRRHRMITQQLASCVTVSPCHLQITNIKSSCNTARPTFDALQSDTLASWWEICNLKHKIKTYSQMFLLDI